MEIHLVICLSNVCGVGRLPLAGTFFSFLNIFCSIITKQKQIVGTNGFLLLLNVLLFEKNILKLCMEIYSVMRDCKSTHFINGACEICFHIVYCHLNSEIMS